MKNKFLLIYGTRPELIKMAPVIKLLKENKNIIDTLVCSTGQHKEMVTEIEEFFEIVPDIQLELNHHETSLGKKFSELVGQIAELINTQKPNELIVHGDTLSAAAGGLSAFLAGIKVIHIEAGLRTTNRKLPYPEEFNRRMISLITDEHFVPTLAAKENLLREGISEKTILITGNTVIDALQFTQAKILNDKDLKFSISCSLKNICGFDIMSNDYVLITAHRRENVGYGFLNICNAIKRLSKKFNDVKFVFPVHLNPYIQKTVNENLSNLENVKLISPQNYSHFVFLMTHAKLLLTDSGGLQEEAPSLGKPVILMRDETERPEILDAGLMELVGTDEQRIYSSVSSLLNNSDKYFRMSHRSDIFGTGAAAKMIIEKLISRDLNK
ncbi:UDP-N-acetylglucosamine 2-epimerase (non-hydrolyzing) [Planktomarina sp.]|nr:UDP-N-acetylglucosamine 2-epimerase (non-hydrolyzing) [Planktomarina sp.]